MSGHYTPIRKAEDVTEEVLEIVREIESGWYNDSPIDWEDMWDRMDGTEMKDGTFIDMGGQIDTPAMQKIQRIIRAERKAG